MINRHNIGIGLVTLLLAGLVVGLSVRGCGMSAEQREIYEAQLEDPSPAARVAAANALLEDDPGRRDVAYTAARAMLLMHWHLDARRLLEGYVDDDDPEGLALLTQAYLDEAEALIETAEYQNLDLRQGDIERLIEHARRHYVYLAALREDDIETRMLEVRLLHVRTALMRLQLEAYELELDQTRSARVAEEHLGHVAGTVGELRPRLLSLEQELDQAIDRATEQAPRSPAPWAFRFFQAMREGQVEAARRHAGRMLDAEAIRRVLAGQVAAQLLTIEAMHALPLTETEIDLARGLLRHEGLTGPKDAHFIVARYYLAMAEQRFDLAAEIAEYLEKLRYPEAPALMALAKISRGEAAEVLETLGNRLDDTRRYDMRFVAARAWLARGQPVHAIGMLRGYVESHPQHLPSRLALAEAMEAADQFSEAGDHIEAAYRLSPTHPRAIRLYVKLLFERGDDAAIASLVQRYLGGRAHDVGLVTELHTLAMMATDRTEDADRWAQQHLEAEPSHPLAHVVAAWSQAPSQRRTAVAMAAMEPYLALLQRQPMQRVTAPSPASIAWSQMHPAPPDDLDLNPEVAYLTYERLGQMPISAAGILVERALLHWPEKPALIRKASRLALLSGHDERAIAWHRELPEPPDALDRAVIASARGEHGSAMALLDEAGEGDAASLVAEAVRLRAAGQQSASATAEVLDAVFERFAWPHELLMTAVAAALRENDLVQAEQYIEIAAEHDALMAKLARARLMLAVGHAGEVVDAMEPLRRDRDASPLLRRWAVDIECSAHVQLGQPDRAFSALSDLHADRAADREAIALAMTDIWIEAGSSGNARAFIREQLRRNGPSSFTLDALLARARVIMEPAELTERLEGLMPRRDDKALLRWYRADLALMMGDLERAERLLTEAEAGAPASPRTALLLARLGRQQQRLDFAIERYRELYDRGGPSRLQAMRELGELAGSAVHETANDRHGLIDPSGD